MTALPPFEEPIVAEPPEFGLPRNIPVPPEDDEQLAINVTAVHKPKKHAERNRACIGAIGPFVGSQIMAVFPK